MDFLKEDTLNIRIRELRKEAGITLDSLSKKTGISVANLSAIESGRVTNPGFRIVQKLSDFYGIKIEQLASTDSELPVLVSEFLQFRDMLDDTQKELVIAMMKQAALINQRQ